MALIKEITQARKIEILSSVGLAPKEIAEILGTTPNTVSVTLSGIRKKAPNSSQEAHSMDNGTQEKLSQNPGHDNTSAQTG
jgi:DNA-binding NarL/FixJ family response regulator